jgi:EmrB/QacA subfamily drug resistance transporter
MTGAGMGTAPPAVTRTVWVVFAGLMIGNALSSLDTTVVATALPTIVGDLHGIRDLSWLATSYLLTAMVSTPLYGKLGDLYGRKRIFLFALVTFLAGSVLCGMAHSMMQLVLFRALQGLGAGGLMSLPFAILGDLVPTRDLAKFIGYSSLVFLVSSVGGPILGGVFAEHLSWRLVFYINVPLGLVSLLVIGRYLDAPVRRTEHRIDVQGALLLVGAITCFVLMSSWGGTRHPWGSTTILGLVIATVVLGLLFVVRERHAPEPVLPGRMLATGTARLAAGINFTTGLVFWPALYFTAAFLQYVHGVEPGVAGVYVAPFMAGAVGGNLVSGRAIARTGRYRAWPIVGGIAAIGGGVVLGLSDSSTPLAVMLTGASVVGFGVGFTMQTVLLVAQNEVELRDIGVATSTTFLARQMGGAIALAALGGVLNNRLAHWIPRLTPPGANLNLDRLRGTPEAIRRLVPAFSDGVVEAFSRSLSAVFWCLVPMGLVWLVLALVLPERPLRSGEVVEIAAVGSELGSERGEELVRPAQ